MQVHFTATFDDLVDVSVRNFKRGRHGRSRWLTLVAAALTAGLVMFVVAWDSEDRLAVGAFGAASVGLMFATLLFWSIKGRFRSAIKQQVGSDAPFEVTVALTPQGVSFHQMNTTFIHEWSAIEAIEDSTDSVDFHTRQHGMAVVRNRAFDSPATRKQFIALAEQLRVDARKAAGG